MNSQTPRVQVRSHTRAAPKNSNSGGNSSGFGIDLAEPPIPDSRIVEQPCSSWPRRGQAPQSDRLPDGPGTGSEPLLVKVGEVMARNEPTQAPPEFPTPGGTMYNTPQGVQRPIQAPGWGFAK
jgi:hypothetical protein